MGKMKECFSKLEGAGGKVYVGNSFLSYRIYFTNGLDCEFDVAPYFGFPLIGAEFYYFNRFLKCRAIYGHEYIFYRHGHKWGNRSRSTSKWAVARRVYNKINSVS